jgi:tetratricopeptide (TPR) repeat protein
MGQLGWFLGREGHYDEAEKMQRQALEGERRILGPGDPVTLDTMDLLARIVTEHGHYDEGERLDREVIEIATRKLGPGNLRTLTSENTLAVLLWRLGRFAEAERENRQALEIERRVLGLDDSETQRTMINLALDIESNNPAETEQLDREVLAHPRGPGGGSRVMNNLAELLSSEGRQPEAEKLFREALAIQVQTLGPENPSTLLTRSNLADVLLDEGNTHEAEKLQRETLASMVRSPGPKHPDTLLCQTNLAKVLIREGHYPEAERTARDAFEQLLRSPGPQHPYTVDALQELGEALAYTHRYAEASKLFRDVIEKQKTSTGKGDHFSVWYSFACVAETANRPDDALQYLQEAVNRGYKNADGLMADDDLKKLHSNPRFQQLVAELKHPPPKVQAQ